MLRTTVISLLILIPVTAAQAQNHKITLHEGWQFREASNSEWQPASVPGTVQEDLLRLGQIPDPLIGTNEDSILWVEDKDWVYQTYFDLPPTDLRKPNHSLVFHGLDTYAEVFLNGQRILTADNMHRTWHTNVSQHVKPQDNLLKIYFHSPIKQGQTLLQDLPYQLPADNDAGNIKVMPVVRKAAFHFGWDWGPRIVTSGIWRPVELVTWGNQRIKTAAVKSITLDSSQTAVSARVEVELEMIGDPDLEAQRNLLASVLTSWVGDDWTIQTVYPGSNTVYFHVKEAQLWWPRGQGEQPLYDLNFKWGFDEDPKNPDFTIRTGIRKAELIAQPDSTGTSFYFEVNDRPVFCKGANYIPQRHFTNSLTKKDYRDLLTTAAASNFNMIRVWGGGIYEEDYFYELCDSLGIMVWQDLMMANTIYPADSSFTQNVLAEVEDNVLRLSHHPSIIHWCGNNEINVAWHNWGWQKTYKLKKKHQKLLYDNYQEVFMQKIPDLLKDHLSYAPYSHTSPLSNWGTPENYQHGSMHHWGVFHGEEPFDSYEENIGRFNSEYGFQSFPHINILKDEIGVQALDLEHAALEHRQKSYKGNRLIYKHLAEYYPQPRSLLELSYLSQLTQAMGISMAIKAHRLDQPRCMGTLYWQLNDCWPAISWSGIDYNGQWRALHHRVKAAYEDCTFFPTKTNKGIILDFINDSSTDISGVLTMDGEQVMALSLKAGEMMTREISCDWAGKEAVQLTWAHEVKTIEKIIWQHSEKNWTPSPTEIQMELVTGPDGQALELKADGWVRNLYLYSDEALHFADNFFDLAPGVVKRIQLKGKGKRLPDPVEIKCLSMNEVLQRKN